MVSSIIKNYTDEDIRTAFVEIVEWRRTGILSEGIIRDIHKKCIEKACDQYYPLRLVEDGVLFEIAKIHYSYGSK